MPHALTELNLAEVEEKRMRDGAEGAATAAAMDLLIRYGDALACDRLCDVRNVAGTMTQPSPVKERLVREGGWDKAFAVINLDCDTDIEVPAMRVPTCQLQHGFGPDALGAVVTRVPALADLDRDPCLIIRTGDWVRVDATHGLIEVKPATSSR
jgi:hypothetical protein